MWRYRVDSECVTQVILRLVAADDVTGVGHVTGRVELAPAQCRQEVEGGAGAVQLAAACALRQHEHVVVAGDHVTGQTTPLRLVVDRVSDPLVLSSTGQVDRCSKEDSRSHLESFGKHRRDEAIASTA